MSPAPDTTVAPGASPAETDADLEAAPPRRPASRLSATLALVRRYPLAALAALVLAAIALGAIFAPFMGTTDPTALAPARRLAGASAENWLGTDHLGRDIWSRLVFGARVSVVVGLAVAVLAIVVGLVIGLFTGFIRWLDPIVMRVMDGLMAIPGILLAIALVSVSGASITTVIIAIVVPEVPRVVRLVRAVVLSVREEPYVEAAISVGTPLVKILWRHVLPNCVPPLIVQATYVAASAMLTEAILSFLGAGTPPTVPSWGNMVAEARLLFQIAPWNLLYPGIALAITILAVNILGDALRDRLDPKLAKRVGQR
ncbi:ABC transporter permease [Salinarimonas sp.]|uniref:ABC transporter permease n=1 Tax=Salinarimonas sp. TaxID=2766526 RepID=UPI003919F795